MIDRDDIVTIKMLFDPALEAIKRTQVFDENDRANLRKEMQDYKNENSDSHKRFGQRLEKLEHGPDEKLAKNVRNLWKQILTTILIVAITVIVTFYISRALEPKATIVPTTQDNTKQGGH